MLQLLSRIYDYTSESDFFTHAMQMGEIFIAWKKVLHDRGLTAVGDEGGLSNFSWRYWRCFDTIKLSVKMRIYFWWNYDRLDCAAAEFYVNGKYDYSKFEGETGKIRSSAEQVDYLAELAANYPIISIEDGMDENDWMENAYR
jgi:enolase